MNSVFSLNANRSCFCLLLTPPIPILYLIKINAICEVELLHATNDNLLFFWNNFRGCTLRLKENGSHHGSFILDMHWKNHWPCWVAWQTVPTMKSMDSYLLGHEHLNMHEHHARYEESSSCCSFCDSIYTAFTVVLVMCRCQEKMLPFQKPQITTCVWFFSLKILLQRQVLKIRTHRQFGGQSISLRKLETFRQAQSVKLKTKTACKCWV